MSLVVIRFKIFRTVEGRGYLIVVLWVPFAFFQNVGHFEVERMLWNIVVRGGVNWPAHLLSIM